MLCGTAREGLFVLLLAVGVFEVLEVVVVVFLYVAGGLAAGFPVDERRFVVSWDAELVLAGCRLLAWEDHAS